MLLPELWRAVTEREGDNMADYEQVTQDVRRGLSRIAANKGDKSVEIIMNEILDVLTTACEQHNVDKFEFIQAFYDWQERFSYRSARPGHCLHPYATSSRRDPPKLRDLFGFRFGHYSRPHSRRRRSV